MWIFVDDQCDICACCSFLVQGPGFVCSFLPTVWFIPTMAEQDLIPMMNWETGVQVGWWQHIGDWDMDDGFTSDWWPWCETATGDVQPIPWHKHPEGYAFIRLPGGGRGGGKKLWHRQLWMDWSGRRLEKEEEVHHKDHSRGNNCLRNLEVVRAEEHKRIHGRRRRAEPRFNRRQRAPRRIRRG